MVHCQEGRTFRSILAIRPSRQSDLDPMINGEIPTANGRAQLLDPSCLTTLYDENYGTAFAIDADCLSASKALDRFHPHKIRTCPTCLWPCVIPCMYMLHSLCTSSTCPVGSNIFIICPCCNSANLLQYNVLHGQDSAGVRQDVVWGGLMA